MTQNETIAPIFRIGYASLLLLCIAVWFPDAMQWFTDAGVLRSTTAERITRHSHSSLLFIMPSTPLVVNSCLAVMSIQAVCLLLGCFSRFQAVCIFVWLVSFQHRNPLICDGEDTVFRLFAFFMIFMPLDAKWALRKSKMRRQSATRLIASTGDWHWSELRCRLSIFQRESRNWPGKLGETERLCSTSFGWKTTWGEAFCRCHGSMRLGS